jgi:hypothetical protein
MFAPPVRSWVNGKIHQSLQTGSPVARPSRTPLSRVAICFQGDREPSGRIP